MAEKDVTPSVEMIVRRVKVNRARTPQQALEATGRRQYVDHDVVASMPGRGAGIEELDVCFLALRRFASDEEQNLKLELRGLKPADPYSLAAVNEADPTFGDDHPNATHWQNARGEWCYAAFGRWGSVRVVRVDRGGGFWGDVWWLAGLRSSS